MSEETTDAVMTDGLLSTPALNELAAALAKAQAAIRGAEKDRTNPHFKQQYATLDSVWQACRKALTEHGLSVVQGVSGDGEIVTVTTRLMHASGQWMQSALALKPVKNDPQAAGSAITYARRYALAGMVGVAPTDDDDGNAGSGRNDAPAQAKASAPAASPAAANPASEPPTKEAMARLHIVGAEVCGGKEKWDAYRPKLVDWATGGRQTSSAHCTGEEVSAMIDELESRRGAN